MKIDVAIQGIRGSFHDIVAKQYFGDNISIVECQTFDNAVEQLLKEKVDTVVMALENSIAGSIIPNYALIDTYDLYIVGEHYVDVQHHLMALPNQSLKDIKEVHSHPMALLQCKDFFKAHPHIKLVEAKDTAEVAKDIKNNNRQKIAAIGSYLAAEIFELEILQQSIQTIKHNETRFAIVKRTPVINKDENIIDKASMKFELNHERGSLAAVLNMMSDCKLNLTKIQSLPIIETPWKYSFFVDVTFEDFNNYIKAKSILEIMAQDLKILGEYKNAKL